MAYRTVTVVMVTYYYILTLADRGNDNWLIKCQRPQTEVDTTGVGGAEQDANSQWTQVSFSKSQGVIEIAAIDNGLAFPFKHPDSWRTCK